MNVVVPTGNFGNILALHGQRDGASDRKADMRINENNV